jgi:TetR/AcrR family transcriptional regulator
MARTRATDYDDKRRAILAQSARLFAQNGYDRASLVMIAQACSMSKALLYHYYHDKADVLFDIIRTHLDDLLDRTAAAERDVANPRERLTALATALLEAYRDAEAEHQVQLNALHLLPPARRDELRGMQKALVDRFAAAIAAMLPEVAPHELKPLTMSLFGMLNWSYLWFDDRGALSRADYARLAVRLIVEGGVAAAGATGDRNRSRRGRLLAVPGR